MVQTKSLMASRRRFLLDTKLRQSGDVLRVRLLDTDSIIEYRSRILNRELKLNFTV